LLDAPQVGSMIQKMAGKGVTQHVRRQAFRVEAGLDRQLLQ